MNRRRGEGVPHWRWIVLGWTLVLITVAGWLVVGFPHPPDGDSVWFLPPMLNFKKSGELINTFVGVNYSPAHDGRFIWHGFLFQMIGGLIMPEANYRGVSIAQFIFEVITLGAGAVLMGKSAPQDGPTAGALLSLLLVLATWLNGFLGRPDLLVCTWCMLGTLAFALVKNSRVRVAIVGVIMGLVAATSPLPSLFLFVLFFGSCAFRLPWRECVVRSVLAGSLALAVFAAAFLFYPYSFSEWVSGVIQHGRYSETPRTGVISSFFSAWLVNFGGSQMLVGFWCGAPILLALMAPGQPKVAWRAGLILSLVAGAVLVIAVAPDTRNYNVSSLLPVFLLPWLGCLGGEPEVSLSEKMSRRLPCIVIIAGLISALPLFREMAIRPHIDEGLRRADAVRLVEAIRKEHPDLDVSSGLFSLFEDPAGLRIVLYPHADRPLRAEWFLVQQINPYRPVPPEFVHYRLVTSCFGNFKPIRVGGIAVANSPGAYNFALYEAVGP